MSMQRQELLTALVLANAFKEGDLALGGSRDEQVRTNARQVLTALRVRDIMATPCVDDGVSDSLRRALNPATVAQTAALYALYRQAGGETRPFDMLCTEGQRTLTRLQQRGLDLGYGCEPDYAPPADIEARLTTIYTHARQAL